MELKTLRNVAIVVAIAAAVYFVPGGGRAASTFEAVVLVGFGVAAGYLGLRAYREHRVAVYSLGDRHRALLYGGVAVALFAWVARKHMWYEVKTGAAGELVQVHRWGGFGELVWFVLVAGVLYAAMEIYRHVRAY